MRYFSIDQLPALTTLMLNWGGVYQSLICRSLDFLMLFYWAFVFCNGMDLQCVLYVVVVLFVCLFVLWLFF